MVEIVTDTFRHIGIVGLGLIGGSIAKAARRAAPAVHISGYDPRTDLDLSGVVDVRAGSIADLASADAVFVCVPVAETAATLQALASLRPQTLVTDVCSTKRVVMRAAEAAGVPTFIGGHPMAGSERSGLDAAREDLFAGRPWLLVRGSAAPADDERLAAWVAALGAVPRWMSAEAHDRAVAYISHLPQMLATALMNAAEARTPDDGPIAAGRAFGEMTRLASSPTEMWTSVLADNADFVREALDELVHQLPAAGEAPGEWVRGALERSHEARERWLKNRDA